MPSDPSDAVAIDLVEYFIVAVPDLEALAQLAPPLAELVRHAAIRTLDIVVVQKDVSGSIATLELDAVEGMVALHGVADDLGGLLSDGDISLASIAVRPDSVGLIVVTEDRWAEPLSAAVQRAGGHIVAGERVPVSRVESALEDRPGSKQAGD